MDEPTLALNLRAGFIRGKSRACGGRFAVSETASTHLAGKLNGNPFGVAYAAYPCVWCRGWHVGRPWTPE